MIVDFIILLFSYVIQAIAWFLPNWNLPNSFYEFTNQVFNDIYSLNYLLPIDTFFEIIKYVIYFELLIIMLKIASGVISYWRGGGHVDI